jgi:hypothetical protein
MVWVNKTLSRGGRLVLIKAVLESIPSLLELNHGHPEGGTPEDQENLFPISLGWTTFPRKHSLSLMVKNYYAKRDGWLGVKYI